STRPEHRPAGRGPAAPVWPVARSPRTARGPSHAAITIAANPARQPAGARSAAARLPCSGHQRAGRRDGMSGAASLGGHPGPYTPADLAAMPDDGQRYELIDGALVVSWSRTALHQRAGGGLGILLDPGAVSGQGGVGSIGVRCGPATVLVPDVVVLPPSVVDEPAGVVVAEHVTLVAEIASPSTIRIDRVLKPRLYADAGIPAYLLVELEGPTVTWFGLSASGGYEQRGVATGEEELRVTEPFEVRIVPGELVRRRA